MVRCPSLFWLLSLFATMSFSSFSLLGSEEVLTLDSISRERCLVQLSYAYMLDKKRSGDISRAEIRGMSKFDSIFHVSSSLFSDSTVSTRQLDELGNFFSEKSNNWYPTGYQIYKVLKAYTLSIEELTVDSIRSIFRVHDTSTNFHNTCCSSLDSIWTTFEVQAHSKNSLNVKSRSKETISQEEPNHIGINLEFWFIGGLFLIIAIMAVFLFTLSKKNDMLSRKYRKYKNDAEGFRSQLKSNNISGQNYQNANYIKSLEGDKFALRKRVNELERQLVSLRNDSDTSFTVHSDHGVKEDRTISKSIFTESFFLGIPSGECIFSAKEKTAVILKDSFYKFDGDREGKFDLVLSHISDLENILTSHEMVFKPVCDYSNQYFSHRHKNIRSLRSGSYKWEGDNIIVTEKIVVEFY